MPRYETLQPEYNLMARDFEQELAPLCRKHGLGVIPYFGLASGFLTGKYRSEADLGKSARGEDVASYLDRARLHACWRRWMRSRRAHAAPRRRRSRSPG